VTEDRACNGKMNKERLMEAVSKWNTLECKNSQCHISQPRRRPCNKHKLITLELCKRFLKRVPSDEELAQALSLLTERERHVVNHKFGEHQHSLKRVGSDYPRGDGGTGVAKERVRQIEVKALCKLYLLLNIGRDSLDFWKCLSGGKYHRGEKGPKPVAMLHIKEVAGMLGVHPNTVRRWTDCGVLECYRIGPQGNRRVPRKAVSDLLGQRRV